MQEEWKVIADFPDYSISNMGNIKSRRPWNTQKNRALTPERIMNPHLTHYGYRAVRLCRDDKQLDKFIHRLVMEAFVGACPVDQEVNHIDGVKTNNRIYNLEYVTYGQQRQHAYDMGLQKKGGDKWNAILDANKVIEIRGLLGKITGRRIAEIYGVSPCTICDIKKGRRWAYVK